MLRDFDLTSVYGPCLGLTRMQRWERAQLCNLNPPDQVRSVLQRLGPNDELNQPLLREL